MSNNTEYAPPQPGTEQDLHVEEANTAEILTPEFRKELADIGFVSVFEALDKQAQGSTDDGVVSGEGLTDDEQLWAQQFEANGGHESATLPGNVILIMLAHALEELRKREERERQTGESKYATTGTPPPAAKPSTTGETSEYTPSGGFAPFKFGYFGAVPPAAAPTGPKPDFVSAPSMADAPLGPKMPDLAFNDVVRPVGKRPDEAGFQAAARANDMLQHSLLKTGWNGGEATPAQMKAARLDMTRSYHPDNPDVSAADKAAFREFNSSQDHADKAKAAPKASQKTEQPAPAASETAQPAQARAETASEAAPATSSSTSASATPSAPSVP